MPRTSRRDQILASATEIFSRDGFDASSVREIAEAAGVRAAAIYYHFDSKEELFAAIIGSHLEDALADLEAIARSSRPPAEKLREAIRANIRGTVRRSHEALIFLLEQRTLPLKRREQFLEMRRRYESLIKSILEEGIRLGEFAPVDVSVTTLAVLGMCNWLPQWYRPDGRLSGDEIADRFADLTLLGLVPARRGRRAAHRVSTSRSRRQHE